MKTLSEAERTEIQEKLAELWKKRGNFVTEEMKLKNEYKFVIDKYKKADGYGIIETPGWLMTIIGIIGFIIGAVALMITMDYIQLSIHPILDYVFLLVLLGISLIGVPALLIAILRYMLEDMVGDIYKLPYRSKYKKYEKEKQRIAIEKSKIVSQMDTLNEKLYGKKESKPSKTTKNRASTSCAGDLINEMARNLNSGTFNPSTAERSLYYDARTGKRLYEHNGKKVDENGNEVSIAYWE